MADVQLSSSAHSNFVALFFIFYHIIYKFFCESMHQ
jgi:hypothetical protein